MKRSSKAGAPANKLWIAGGVVATIAVIAWIARGSKSTVVVVPPSGGTVST